MASDSERVYMLLELERIRQQAVPHLYVFPTGVLEFSCVVFKGPRRATFRLAKSRICDGWDVLGAAWADTVPRSRDAHVVLKSAAATLDKLLCPGGLEDSKPIFPFVPGSIANRRRNIAALLLYAKGRQGPPAATDAVGNKTL